MSDMDILLFVVVILLALAMIGWGTYLLLRDDPNHHLDVTWGVAMITVGFLIIVLYAIFG